MGLIKAGIGALGGTLADQWKEFFYCDALPNDVLMRRGQKQITGRSSNTKGNDNIISNGSGIAVADGQCMIIVDQGKIVEVCAEPGEYTFDTSSEPSIFSGKFGESLKESFRTLWKRFTYGGDTGKDQRVYYFNTKEILNNKFGTANPIMFEVVNKRIGMSRTVQVRCNGVYTYVISDPLVFYSRLCGNVATEFTRDEIDAQLKVEFVDALQPALAALAEQELRPAQIPAKANELKAAMNDALKQEWIENRGISVAKIALNPITLTDADMKKINEGTSVSVDRPMVDAMKRGLPFLTPARGIMQYGYDAYYSENPDFHPMYLQQQIRVVYDINDIISDYLVDYYNSYSRETYDITPVTALDLSPDTEELFSMDDYPERFFRWADEFISLIS